MISRALFISQHQHDKLFSLLSSPSIIINGIVPFNQIRCMSYKRKRKRIQLLNNSKSNNNTSNTNGNTNSSSLFTSPRSEGEISYDSKKNNDGDSRTVFSRLMKGGHKLRTYRLDFSQGYPNDLPSIYH